MNPTRTMALLCALSSCAARTSGEGADSGGQGADGAGGGPGEGGSGVPGGGGQSGQGGAGGEPVFGSGGSGGATPGSGGGTAGTASGGSPPGGGNGTFMPAASGCAALTVMANAAVDGYQIDRYNWSDAACQPRSAALVHNDAADPGGSRGGFLRELTWKLGNTTRTSRGTGGSGWNGWGYVVNHHGNGADTSNRRTGTYRTLFAGAHHAIHEFKLRMSPGGPMDVTVHWFFATGRSNPVYAITFDLSPSAANAINADTRAPYGDIAFEGSAGDIAGISWGDKYRFTTTGAGPVTPASAWTYSEANTVPFVRMWSGTVDAEMGAVQTQTWERQPAGGDYGGGDLKNHCWNKTSANKGANCSNNGQTMPKDWLWPYQLNQYELPFTTVSHRLAWGSNYGAIGQTTLSAFGKTLSGYPRVSYSVFMVIGAHSENATLAQMTAVEHLTAAALSASVGRVATTAPGGAGRTDAVTLTPAGYDPVFGTYVLAAAQNKVTAALDASGGAVATPMFRITGYSAAAPARVTVNGAELAAGTGYFASVDAATNTLWLTLNGTLTGRVTVQVD